MPFPFRYFEANGYGAVTRGFVCGLARLGVDIRVPNVDYSKFSDGSDLHLTPEESDIWNEIRAKPDDPSIATSIQISVPHAFKPVDGNAYLYTMTERTNWPERYSSKQWLEKLNTPKIRVITPTQWNKDTWEDGGVINSIDVVPCGVDFTKLNSYRILNRSTKFRKFTFLSVFNGLGDDSSRENWRFLMKAMELAFTGDDSVEWLVKTNKVHPDFTIPANLSMRIIDDPSLSESEMAQLYTSSHIFVKNSVEGWGMPTMESMALELPVIHSFNTAPTEYLNSSNALLFAPNDLDTLVKHLKFAKTNYHSDSLRKTVRSASTTARAYSWESASLKLMQLLFLEKKDT